MQSMVGYLSNYVLTTRIVYLICDTIAFILYSIQPQTYLRPMCANLLAGNPVLLSSVYELPTRAEPLSFRAIRDLANTCRIRMVGRKSGLHFSGRTFCQLVHKKDDYECTFEKSYLLGCQILNRSKR